MMSQNANISRRRVQTLRDKHDALLNALHTPAAGMSHVSTHGAPVHPAHDASSAGMRQAPLHNRTSFAPPPYNPYSSGIQYAFAHHVPASGVARLDATAPLRKPVHPSLVVAPAAPTAPAMYNALKKQLLDTKMWSNTLREGCLVRRKSVHPARISACVQDAWNGTTAFQYVHASTLDAWTRYMEDDTVNTAPAADAYADLVAAVLTLIHNYMRNNAMFSRPLCTACEQLIMQFGHTSHPYVQRVKDLHALMFSSHVHVLDYCVVCIEGVTTNDRVASALRVQCISEGRLQAPDVLRFYGSMAFQVDMPNMPMSDTWTFSLRSKANLLHDSDTLRVVFEGDTISKSSLVQSCTDDMSVLYTCAFRSKNCERRYYVTCAINEAEECTVSSVRCEIVFDGVPASLVIQAMCMRVPHA
jgi:hypothetical protein